MTDSTFTPQRGLLVTVADTPGVFQLVDRSRFRHEWWLIPWDDAARTSPNLFQGFLRAHVLDMTESR